jgi:hypothetical protein
LNATSLSYIFSFDISYDPITIILFILLFSFIGIYLILSLIFGERLLSLKPSEIMKDWKELQDYYFPEWNRELNFSGVLAGFALTALTLIIALNVSNVTNRIHIVEFFLFAFIFEMLSFISFKYMVKTFYDFLGTLLQFSGLLALLNGFFLINITIIGLSHALLFAFFIGYLGFFILCSKQLNTYIYSMKNYNKQP